MITNHRSATPRNYKILLLLSLWLLNSLVEAAVVLGIDYGTEWFKVALVKPGVPLDLVLNRESKRKTQSLITLRSQHDILFGSDSNALASRFSTRTFDNLKALLGKSADDPLVVQYAELNGYVIRKHPLRNTPTFVLAADHKQDKQLAMQPNSTSIKVVEYSVEELVGMQLIHAKDQAEIYAGAPIGNAVLTVPPFFSPAERQALIDAAELANLKVVGIIHDETAVAINYAMGRQFPKPQKHIFYDMGAGSTVASLVQFEAHKNGVKIKTLHVGYDESLGGRDIDQIIVKRLMDTFKDTFPNEGKDIASNPKAFAKLYKEAARVKIVLSVNPNVPAGVEALHKNKDLRTSIKRTDVEADLKELIPRFEAPLLEALDAAGGASNVESLVLVGGGTRSPIIQQTLEKLMGGTDKLAKHVNSDEAAVLGAAFRAAGMTRGFKVRNIQITDSLPFSIHINDNDNEAVLFPAHNAALNTFRPMTFNKANNLHLNLTQRHASKYNAGRPSARLLATITTEANASYIEQQMTFKLLHDGRFAIENATGTHIVSSGLLGLSNTNNTSPLSTSVRPYTLPLSDTDKELARERISAWKNHEAARIAHDNARNKLESLVYSCRSRAQDEMDLITKMSTPEERSQLAVAAQKAGDWLESVNDAEATVEALEKHFDDLHQELGKITDRTDQVKSHLKSIREHSAELDDSKGSVWVDEYEQRSQWDAAEVSNYAEDLLKKVTALREQKAKEAAEKAEKERLALEKLQKEIAEMARKEKEAREKAEQEKIAQETAANETKVDTPAELNSTQSTIDNSSETFVHEDL